ncbi:META domain-containing protein [Labilibacter sediminis]|nr:META domain-containing protein [Labilibacter sediminis]
MKKHILTAFIISILTLPACNTSKKITQKKQVSINNSWELIEYNGSAIDTEVFNRAIPTFTFNSEEGSFGGNNGCNSVQGKMEVDGSKIKLNIQLGTKMYCEGVPEAELEAKISEVNNYKIQDKKLILNKDKETLFVFKLVEQQ